ncbi:MAG: BlaI/MecI/CopY family transcriptional regulator, partial [Verrucomicrobiota bacterium]
VMALVADREHSSNLGTVRTHLRRLVEKDLVAQEKSGRAMIYTPLISMEDAVKAESDRLLGRVPTSGYGIALSRFCEGVNLSDKDLEQLKKLIGNSDSE